MSDKKQPGDKKTSGTARSGRLELKRPVDVGSRAGAGGGRSSNVQVEVRKKRGPKRDERPATENRNRQERSPITIKQSNEGGSGGGRPRRENRNRGDQTRGRMVLPKLTDDEKARRAAALKTNIAVQAERRKKAEEEARVRAIEEERRRKEEEEAAKRAAEEEARRREEEAARRKSEEEAERRRAEEDERQRKADEAVARAKPAGGDAGQGRRDGAGPRRDGAGPRRDGAGPRRDGAGPRRDGAGPRRDGAGPRRDGPGARPAAGRPAGGRPAADAPAPAQDDRNKGGKTGRRGGPGGKPGQAPQRPQQNRGKPGGDRRRGGRLTVSQAMSDNDPRQKSLAAMRRRQQRGRNTQEKPEAQHIVRDVIVPESITVGELANRMAVRSTDVVKSLMKLGVMATINQVVDADTAELVVEEFGHNMKRVADSDVEIAVDIPEDGEATLKSRPPVVTVMGHVDHGKTSVLDALRNASVVAREAGGITQHIGAYQIVTEGGDRVTFIDTPGHAAFTSMRSRGAKVTDIVVLVVSADDSVMPQTIEAINHAKAAEVPIIVAVNKIDKPDSNPNKVKQDLLQHEVFVEDLGGEVLCVEISALKGTNLDKLIDAINLQSELLELKANPDRSGNGSVVEAQLEQGRGAVGTVLVQGGTLKVGDIFVAGATYGRIRALIDDHGQRIQEAPPSCPVEVLGFQDAPEAGDDFVVLDDEAKAREIAEFRQRKAKENRNTAGARGTLEQMLSAIKEGKAAELPILIKGDVQGSVEAIIAAAEKISTNEVKAQILHSGVGGITETDVTLAQSAGAVIFGFNTRPNKQAREAADREGVDIRYYNVIYELTDDLKALMAGLLSPDRQENTLGMAEVRQVFNITKVGKIAGCLVTEGAVKRNANFRQQRDGIVLHEGVIANLKHYKDEVAEVRVGSECGIAFENHQDIQEGDLIEVFEIKEVARTL